MLSIVLFGSPQLILDRRVLTLTRRKSRALIYYLATQPNPVTRDHLLAFFWPDHNRPAAQQILRTTLHGLRQTLGPALLVEENTLALALDVEIDARRFEAQLTLSTSSPDFQGLTEALDLYRGDFLADFSLADTLTFEDWLVIQRERYRRLAVRGLTTLSQWHEAQHNFRAALDALERALAFDPLQEDLQRACLRLHYLAGDRAGAIRRYENLRQLLDEEMGVPPMAETHALYDAIITDTLSVSLSQPLTMNPPPKLNIHVTIQSQRPPLGNSLPFTGRTAELKKLRTLVESPKVVLIEGEPGMGKSRLIAEFIRMVEADIKPALILALASEAHELEHKLPYQPLIEALRHLLVHPEWPRLRANLDLPAVWWGEIARLLPELAQPGMLAERNPPVADETRLWEGVYQFLLVLAHQRRIILALDDLQWADAATLGLLGYLVRQAAGVAAPLFFITAARPVDPRSPLAGLWQTLLREGHLERLTLARLTSAETLALARHLSPTQAEPLAAWLTQAAEGNPYIVAELVRHTREHNRLLPDGTFDASALSDSPLVPQTVYTLIQSRLARLSEPARRVLDTAVAVGREFDFDVVARATGLSENAALDALDELRAAGLVYPQEATSLRFTFDHSLTMEVAYQEVGEPRHRLLHRRVAEALESLYGRHRLDTVAGLLAQHFAEGGDAERAAPYAFRAGQLASGLAAWTEAIAFFEQALAGAADMQRFAILMALGEARLHTGEFPQSSAAFREAQARADDSASVDAAQIALAESLVLQGRYAEVIEVTSQVSETGQLKNRVHAGLLLGRTLMLQGVDLGQALRHLQNAEALLGQQDDSPTSRATLSQVKFEMGNATAQQGDLPGAITFYREALVVSRRAATEAATRWHILAYNNLAYHLHLLGDPDSLESALAYARTGLALAHEKGAIGLLPYLQSTLGEITLAQGDLAAAEHHLSEGLALAERFSIPERIAGLTANLGRVAAQQGRSDLAIYHFTTACAHADELGNRYMAAQIRLWLVPLLPSAEAHLRLAEAHAISQSSGYHRLLAEAARLEARIEAGEGKIEAGK